MEQVKEVQVVPTIKERVDKNGRRWVQDNEARYDSKIKDYMENSPSPNKYLIKRYLDDMAIGDSSKDSARREMSKSRRLRVLQILDIADGAMGHKDFRSITKEDIKLFVSRLKDDTVISPTQNKPYADTTKATFRKVIKKFWKWFKGKNGSFPEEVDWIDTHEPIPTKDCYTLEEMELLIDNIHSPQMRTLVKLSFDGGFRIGEIMNIRIKDITPPTPEENWYTVRVRAEIAKKNKERFVPLFYSNQDLKAYLENHHPEPRNKEAFLFYYTYAYVRNFLYQKGKKVVGRSITPHGIRRTSATFFAPRINNYQLFCARYGWDLSSRVPDRYFNQNKVRSRDMMNQVVSYEIGKARVEMRNQIVTNQMVIEENARMKEQMNRYELELHQRKRYDSVIQKLLSEPAIKQKVTEMLGKKLDSETALIESSNKARYGGELQ